MLQEDSNGEASFEIIDKKQDDSSNNDKTESISSVSSPYSIPSPGSVPLPGGNLLSNIPPPSNLPDFTLVPSPTPLPPNLIPTTNQSQEIKPTPPIPVNVQPQPFPQPQFSAAIPPSKGIQHGRFHGPTPNVDLNQGSGSGLIGWMKDAVSSGGIFSKVAEKAKNSVDTLITTLDPQMSEFIYSGGDVEIAVACQDPEELTPIREGIFSVFGKAWVNGVPVKTKERKHQAVGFEEGTVRAQEKLQAALDIQKMPTIAVENILLHQGNDWFDLSVILLEDVDRHITLKTYTQTTPIPVDDFLKQAEKEMPGYTIGSNSVAEVLSAYLQMSKNNWQQTVCGISRNDTLSLATKTIVALYKNKLTAT